MKHLSILLALSFMIISTGCEKGDGPTPPSSSTPAPSFAGQKVKKEYYTGGMLRSEFIMTDNTGMNGTLKRYGFDGKLTSIVTMKNGVKHGIERLFDPNGRVIRTIPYVNGRIHGVATKYYPNGDPMVTITYKGGYKEGPAIKYRKDGKIYEKVMFRNDRMVN
jgi:antitoxin component YwqK of YwqJK toxin-antitoxin module